MGSSLPAVRRDGLDPRYAHVILARWERFVGDVAERIDG